MRSMVRWALAACTIAASHVAGAAAQAAPHDTGVVLLVPARVFDAPAGVTHAGSAVLRCTTCDS